MAPQMLGWATNDWEGLPGGDDVKVLTDSTIKGFIKSTPAALIMFYAPCNAQILMQIC